MQHKDFSQSTCPVARSLDLVGEWWSIMILRDAFFGATRFDQFQKNLDISPGMLTKRLAAMVEGGLLERRAYSHKPVRHNYVLTDRAKAFFPVLAALTDWGNAVFEGEAVRREVIDNATGKVAEPLLIDRLTGRAIDADGFRFST
jgi:DNA-binding HxlR family transcriptional regulator